MHILKLEMKLQLSCYHENSNISHSLLELLTQGAYIFLNFIITSVGSYKALAAPTGTTINHVSSELLPMWREPPPRFANSHN